MLPASRPSTAILAATARWFCSFSSAAIMSSLKPPGASVDHDPIMPREVSISKLWMKAM